jgi:hypothetical protein
MPKKQVCKDIKACIRDKLEEVRHENRIRIRFIKHIENKYINGRKKREILQFGKYALDNLISRDNKNIEVKDLNTSIAAIKAFLEATPVVIPIVHGPTEHGSDKVDQDIGSNDANSTGTTEPGSDKVDQDIGSNSTGTTEPGSDKVDQDIGSNSTGTTDPGSGKVDEDIGSNDTNSPDENNTSGTDVDNPVPETYFCVIKLTKIGNNGKLYMYTTGFYTDGVDDGVIGKQFHMSHSLFNVSHTIHETETSDGIILKNKYSSYFYEMGQDVIDKRIHDDHQAWSNLMSNIQDIEKQQFLKGLESSVAIAEFVSIDPVNATGALREEFYDREIRDSVNEVYVDTRFIKFGIDLQNPFLVEPHQNDEYGLKQSCFFKAIMSTYKNSFDKYHKTLRRGADAGLEMTTSLISKICMHREYRRGDELNMRLFEALRFFKTFQVGLRIFDPRGNVLIEELPNTYHSKIRPRILDVVYNNNHITPISDVKSFEQLMASNDPGCLPSSYVFKKYDMDASAEYIMASSFNDVLERIRGMDHLPDKIRVVWKGQSLNDLLLDFVNNGYSPSIQVNNGISVTCISFRNLYYEGKNIQLYIGLLAVSQGDEEVTDDMDSIEIYRKYKKLESLLFEILIHPHMKSEFDNDTKCIFAEYSVPIPTGSTEDMGVSTPIAPSMIDMCKHYASCIANAPNLISISPFEKFYIPEPGFNLNREMLYIVDILPACNNPVYKLKDRTLMFYDELSDLVLGVDVAVYACIRLILHPNDMLPVLVRDIFEDGGPYSDIPMELRKGLVNRAIGELGRKKNRLRTASVFKNHDDAIMHKLMGGGVLYALADNVWVVKRVVEKEINDGFVPMNEMIKSIARHQMSTLWKRLTSLHCQVIGFKTDAVYFYEPQGIDLQSHIKDISFVNGRNPVGKAKYSHDIDRGYPRTKYITKLTNKQVVTIRRRECVAVDECTVNNIRDRLRPGSIVLADAGCGKTYSLLHHLKERFKASNILVVTAWNAQASKIKYAFDLNAITWHHLRGARLDDTVRLGTRGYDVSDVSVIVFDEIMLFDHAKLVKISKYMKSHPHIEFYATGDPKQLEAIGDVVNNMYKIQLLSTSALFPRVLGLGINLRICEEDRERLGIILASVGKICTKDLVDKFFQKNKMTMDEFKESDLKRGIAFYNSSTRKLNKLIHPRINHSKHKLSKTKVIDGLRYHFGDTLVCKQQVRVGNYKLHVNYQYTIESMNDKIFRLKDTHMANKVYDISTLLIPTHFAFPYCSTVHSSQGGTVNEPYVVADIYSDHVTDNWVISAITRCSRLDDIHILTTSLKSVNVDKNISEMVNHYKYQDRMKGFIVNAETIVTYRWIRDAYKASKGMCKYCGEEMTFEKNEARKVTVNRLNNRLGHIFGNIEVCCWKCNNILR